MQAIAISCENLFFLRYHQKSNGSGIPYLFSFFCYVEIHDKMHIKRSWGLPPPPLGIPRLR